MQLALSRARSSWSMEAFLQSLSINKHAIIINPADNVAVVKHEIAPKTVLRLADGRKICVTSNVSVGHRVAIKPIPSGELVLQYGQPIGTSLGIIEGAAVSHANMSDEVPVRR